MSRLRTVQAVVELPLQRMSPSFRAYGLRSGGPIALDPFLHLDDFEMSEPTFPPHPHAGFSAVTYMFEDSEGAFVNRDSLGDRSIIGPGAFHWTQAARGMMHEEIPERRGARCHGLQMFVNLREADKLAAPRAFHVAASDVPEVSPSEGVRVRVLAGSFAGVSSPLTELLTAVTFLDVHLGPNATVEVDAPAADTAFVFVVGGRGHVDGEATVALPAHSAAGFVGDGDRLRLVAGDDGLHVLVGVGTPIGEPVVFGGPFAMTNADALREANARFRRGEMGHLDPSF
jgi:redox-sensitive bicupin YhaK (pirin superfamily)